MQKSIKIKAAYHADSEMLHVHVADKGRGIDEKSKKQLFALFGKLEDTENINTEGVGMGLTICQRIVENNSGLIDVHSEGLEKGSTFMFSMKM